MTSKAFQQICEFLDSKEIRYGTDGEGTDRETIFFGAKGLVTQKFLFIVETKANVVQFRSVQMLDDEDLQNYHDKPENRVKLYEYLLKCNYEWKLGKFALDPEDEDVDLYFVISDYVEADKGIEEDLLDRVHTMLLGPSFAPSHTEKAIKNIKTILATGEKNEDEDDAPSGLMEALAKKFAEEDPEFAKKLEEMAGEGGRRKPSKDDDLEDGI